MQIHQRQVASLSPNAANPRQHSKRQIRQIAASIRTFGFNVPILIDGAGKITAGQGRYLAAVELGMHEVPTISLEHLSPAQVQAFMIATSPRFQ